MAQGYARLYRRIWHDEKFLALSVNERFVAINILAGQSNRIGLFRYSIPLGSEHTGLAVSVLGRMVASVCSKLSWGWDRAASVVLIPSWWRYNAPDSSKTLKGYLRDLEDVPVTPLRETFYGIMDSTRPGWRDTLSGTAVDQLDRVCDRVSVPNPIPNPIPNQALTKPETDTPLSPTSDVWGVGFDTLWAKYPHYGRRSKKAPARQRWMSLTPRPSLADVLVGLAACAMSDDWTREGGRFVPACEVWIGQRGWDASDGASGKATDVYTDFINAED